VSATAPAPAAPPTVARRSPLVSVLLPYRNNAPTIEEALRSVLAERAVDLEVLAIDDGSTDPGPAIVADIARADPRVVPVATSGVGIAAALAWGAARCRGEFVARMDGDDISLPGRIEAAVALLESNPSLGLAATQVEGFPESAVGEGLRRYIDWQNSLVTPADHRRELFVESPVCHPAVVMRRAALVRAGGFADVRWAEDYDLWLRIDAAGFGLAKVPRVLFRWRHREGRLTFSDGRYALPRFDEAKARYLAPKLLARGRPVTVWGAGKTGKRIARALEAHGVRASSFIDIDPRKIGGTARGARVSSPETLARGEATVVCAVGARGARDLIRAHLCSRGFVEGDDYLFAS
jgi:glycosyltransferase involved in cell wall biosynthesis